MSLNSRIKVPLPENGIIVRRREKYPYVYKVLSTYRAENGNPTNKRKSIGKLDPESGMLIPNDSYWEFYGNTPNTLSLKNSDEMPTFDSVRSIGASYFIKRIMDSIGITDILKETFSDAKATAIMTIAMYMMCRGNVLERIFDWCESYTIKEPMLTSQSSSSLFSSITYNERMAFFRRWVAHQAHNDYYAYDVTSFSSYAEGIPETEWGYNRDGEKLPQINLGCYIGQKSRLPVFYVTYPGSIVDKSHLQYMMAYHETLGIGKVCFVMDKGFCTTGNINYMHSKQLPYVMGVDKSHKSIRTAIDSVREGITSMRFMVKKGLYARSIRSRFYGSTSTLHVFYDPGLAERQRSDLFRLVESKEEKLTQLKQLTKAEVKHYHYHFDIVRAEDGTFTFTRNYDKIDEVTKDCGFFCILTNTASDSAEVLAIYRDKDTIEKSFDDLKNHVDMKRLRVHSSNAVDGKLFCSFLSLIAAMEISNRLSVFMKEKALCKGSLISELEKIKVVYMNDGRRLMNPLTKTQRTIFETCGFSVDDLIQFVNS